MAYIAHTAHAASQLTRLTQLIQLARLTQLTQLSEFTQLIRLIQLTHKAETDCKALEHYSLDRYWHAAIGMFKIYRSPSSPGWLAFTRDMIVYSERCAQLKAPTV